MLRRTLICVAALGMGGCATISKETAFDGTSGAAFALVAGDGMRINGSESFSFGFVRVDVEQLKFLPDQFFVNFSGMPALEGDEFKRPEDLQTTVRFAGKSVAVAGNYALVARRDHAAYGYVNNTNVNCYTLGAAVYRIEAGHIVLIPVGHVQGGGPIDRAALRSQSSAVLANFPNMTAPRATAEVIGTIKFETQKGFMKDSACIPEGTFTFTPLS
jgi:hypothetical protein